MKFEMDPDAMQKIYELYDNMLESHLGPAIRDEVIRNTPVDLGHLRDSVTDEVDRGRHVLTVSAYGDEEREAENRKYYAAWVDLGHRLIAWGHDTGRVIKPTAFMRRALYRKYPGF